MYQKAYSISGTVLIALLMAVVTPASAQAQRHGGGGGNFGGFHGGGRFGGFHGGSHFGGFRGGVHRGFSNFGSFPHYGYRNYGYRPYYGGYSYSYPSYGYYPYSYGSYPSDSGYYPYYYGYYPSYSSDDASGTVGPSVPDGTDPSLSPSTSLAAPPQPDTRAYVTLTVPADAEVSFDGVKMGATGMVRVYSTPPLTPGQRYAYEVRASWQEGGRTVTQSQRVPVTSGAHPAVTFPVTRTEAVAKPQ